RASITEVVRRPPASWASSRPPSAGRRRPQGGGRGWRHRAERDWLDLERKPVDGSDQDRLAERSVVLGVSLPYLAVHLHLSVRYKRRDHARSRAHQRLHTDPRATTTAVANREHGSRHLPCNGDHDCRTAPGPG